MVANEASEITTALRRDTFKESLGSKKLEIFDCDAKELERHKKITIW